MTVALNSRLTVQLMTQQEPVSGGLQRHARSFRRRSHVREASASRPVAAGPRVRSNADIVLELPSEAAFTSGGSGVTFQLVARSIWLVCSKCQLTSDWEASMYASDVQNRDCRVQPANNVLLHWRRFMIKAAFRCMNLMSLRCSVSAFM